MRICLTYFFVAFLSVLTGFAQAQTLSPSDQAQSSVFFDHLPDIPVMPGLMPLSDHALLFDKAEGRIAEVIAVSEGPGMQEILRFYGETLPSLGWQRVDNRHFVRDQESLTFTIEKADPQLVIRFRLAPIQTGL